MAGGGIMLINAVEDYLRVRHAAGFDLKYAGKVLRRFSQFSAAHGETHVHAPTAIEWSTLASSPGERSRRLKAVIRFADYAKAEDDRHDIPPDGCFGYHKKRRVPFIFSPTDVSHIVEQAMHLGPLGSLRPHTYATMFALLSATGMRISEALALRVDDITPEGLIICKTKFRKSRLLPLHPTAVAGLERYLARRSRVAGGDDHLFVSLSGHGFCYETVRSVFHKLVRAAGIGGSDRRKPRIHGLRHTFAVRALEACACDRDHVGKHILALSTYMGHAHVADTYWYLEATPQLLGDIAKAWETFVEGVPR
jgi:integrase/recombinase XerD